MLHISRNTIFVWFGGVVTNTIPELTMQSLRLAPSTDEYKQKTGEINDLADKLSLGIISSQSYCESVIYYSHASLDINTLEDLITNSASLNSPCLDLINSIPGNFEKWLISDFPEEWFQKIASRTELSAYFSSDQTIFTIKGGFERMVPGVFDYLAKVSGKTLDECILIDSKSSRAVKAVRYGLSAIIYVYPERLEHEFALRGIFETNVEVLHPQISKRVEI